MREIKCNKCGKVKNESEFYFKKDFECYRNECKKCTQQSNKKWRDKKENKIKQAESQKRYRDRNKDNPEFIKKRRLRDIKIGDKKRKNIHFKENEFSKNEHKYNKSIIKYDKSPTGSAYIGLAKSPLMKNENGIGFKGVKLQSENRELIQCFECGKWYKVISPKHLKCHNLTLEEYKDKYGYNKNCSLISDVYSNYLASQMVNNVNKKGKRLNQEILNKKLKEGRKEYKKKNLFKKHNNTIEQQNLHGTCPLQLKVKFINHINRFHRIPCTTKGRDGFTSLTTIKKRYGNLNNYLKELGLPTRIRMIKGNLIEYKFPDNYLFYTKNGKGYEELYLIMKKKCSVLSDNFNK